MSNPFDSTAASSTSENPFAPADIQLTPIHTGASNKSNKRPSQNNDNNNNNSNNNNHVAPAFYQLVYWRFLFNVETSQVLSRILASVTPIKATFLADTAKNPDFYGLVWLSTTLIFVMGVTANFATYFDAYRAGTEQTWSYDFTKLTTAASIIYGYVCIVPLLFSIILHYYNSPLRAIQVLCLYGYAIFAFIPIAFLCAFGNQIFRWILVGVGFLITDAFIVCNLFAPLHGKIHSPSCLVSSLCASFAAAVGIDTLPSMTYVILLLLTVLHGAFCVTLQVVFFSSVENITHSVPQPPPPANSSIHS